MRGFALTRSMLLSVTTIGAVLAVFAAASTFAAFTDSDSDSGTVTAGNVEVTVQGTGAPGLIFVPGTGADCPVDLAPGDNCVDTVTVTNTGSLDVTLGVPDVQITDITGAEGTCVAGDWSATAGAYTFEDAGDATLTDSPTDDEATFEVTVELLAGAQTGCQGATAEVTVTVEATSA